MTMMISKFNKLIRSKVLWIIFFVIIVFSFVIWAMPWPARSGMETEATAAGMLDGKPVSFNEYNKARAYTMLELTMTLGKVPQIPPQLEKQMRKTAWKRVAALRMAENMGLRASDNDVVATIHNQPLFMTDGAFNQSIYQSFVMNYLRNMGISEPQFEEYIREEIVLQKLHGLISQSVLISPYELQRAFRTITDEFDLQYLTIKTAAFSNQVQISRSHAEAYFATNRTKFTLSPKVVVKYASFGVTNYLDRSKVTEEEALSYYNDNVDLFAQATNAAYASTEGTNDLSFGRQYKPFAQVKEDIIDKIAKEKARDAAAEKATDFLTALLPGRDGKALSFEDAAKKYKVAVRVTPAFGIEEPIKGVDAFPYFNQAAFNLRTNSIEESYSDAIPGEDYAYVLALTERQEARTPKFSEVTNIVFRAAFQEELKNVAKKKAEAIRNVIENGLKSGQAFSKTASSLGFTANVLTNVTVMNANSITNNLRDLSYVLPAVLMRNQGEVTDIIPADGDWMIAYVTKRTATDPAMLNQIRPQIISSLRRERTEALFSDWQDELLKDADLKDMNASPAVDDDNADDGEEKP